MIDVSIVLPTYNRLEQLKHVLDGFATQSCDMAQVEIIVVSDGSTDGTHEYLQTATLPYELVAIEQENAGPAAARNRGVDAARGRLILFVDDDVVPAPELIAEHLRSHAEHGPRTVVMGPMLTPEAYAMQPWVQWEQLMLYKQYADMEAGRWRPTARQFYTGNASLERQYLIEQRGFDTSFLRAEDVELAYRLAANGLSFVFNAKAIGYHYASRKFSSWQQTPYLYGCNDVRFTRDKGQTWLVPKVMAEFQKRNVLIRIITKLSLSRPRTSRLVIALLKQLATISNRCAQFVPTSGSVSRFAYSGIYNLTYYQGFADELGGRQDFFEMASKTQSAKISLNQSEPGVV